LLEAVVEGMQEKKAKNIMILDLNKIENRVTDYFVICDADSNTHVNSIADSVEEIVEKLDKGTCISYRRTSERRMDPA
jgi:ribosome-associated protein